MIDQSDRFVFKPLLYELLSGAASEEEVAPPFAQLLGPYPVTFLQGRVASVQPEHATQVRAGRGDSSTATATHSGAAGAGVVCWRQQMLTTAACSPRPPPLPLPSVQDGGSTGGGVVMLQDGASVPYDWLVVSLGAETSTFGIPGVKDCALPFSTYQDAERVRRRLPACLLG